MEFWLGNVQRAAMLVHQAAAGGPMPDDARLELSQVWRAHPQDGWAGAQHHACSVVGLANPLLCILCARTWC